MRKGKLAIFLAVSSTCLFLSSISKASEALGGGFFQILI